MKLAKTPKTFFLDDGHKRGPMTMSRVQFHPSEPWLFAQCVDRRLGVWNVDEEPQSVKGQKSKVVVGQFVCSHEIGWIRGFDVHPNGSVIATGGSDKTLRLWNWRDGSIEENPSAKTQAHDGWVEAVAFSLDGSQLVTAGADKSVKLWDATSLQLVDTLGEHNAYAADAVYSPDGKLIVSGGEDGVVIVWDAQSHKELRRIDFGSANTQTGQNPRHSGVHRVSVSHDNKWLAVAGGEKANVYNIQSGELVATEKLRMDVAFHPSNDVIAIGDNETKLWSFEAQKLVPPEKDKNGKAKSPGSIPGNVSASIKRGDWSLGLCFSADNKRFGLGKANGTVEVYEVST